MPIRRHLAGKSFDPDVLAILKAAFEGACADLRLGRQASHLSQTVAKKVFDELANGQRDPEAIRLAVVASLATKH